MTATLWAGSGQAQDSAVKSDPTSTDAAVTNADLAKPGSSRHAELTENAIAVVPDSRTILVLGDSISAASGLEESDGWVQLMADRLSSSHPGITVVNASISGDTSGGGLQRLPDAISKFDPDIIIVELGGNDGLRGQSLKLMRENLSAITVLAQKNDANCLILGMRIPTNYGAVYTERFYLSFQTVAESTNSALVPFLLAPIASDQALFQADGIHPSKEAQPLMMELVLAEIEKMLNSNPKNTN